MIRASNCLCSVLLIAYTSALFAQTNKAGTNDHLVWKAHTTRLISTRDSMGANGLFYKKIYGDTGLSKYLFDAVFSKKLKPLATPGYFASSDTPKNIRNKYDLFYYDRSDRKVWIADTLLPYNNLTDYWIREEWQFDPFTFQAKINITDIVVMYHMILHLGVSPPNAIVDWVTGIEPTETYEWHIQLFGLKWEDAKGFFAEYQKDHPQKNLQQNWWLRLAATMSDSGYSSQEVKTIDNMCRKKNANKLEVCPDRTHKCENSMDEDELLCTALYDSIQDGELLAYGVNSTDTIAKNELIASGYDTLEIRDPITNTSITRHVQHNTSSYQCFRYFISGEWTLDMPKGEATHHITDMIQRFESIWPYDTSATMSRINSATAHQNPAFRLRFKDVKNFIQRYEARNASSFAHALWQSHKITMQKAVY